MSSEIAIKVEGLSKCYQIYEQPRDRLKQFVLPRIRRVIGLQPKQYYREFWALQDVSFEVKKGETVGIIGRNGSGKSTLLQMICGTLNPSRGQVQTKGRVAALLELGSGFNPEFTGRENVYLNASVLGLSKEEIDRRFDAIAAFADIGEFIKQPVKTYSSGMMMRLAFAVIAHVDADILVVDEALSVGDAVFVQKCNLFLRRFAKNGTLLFVSHSMQSVLDLCDRAVWITQGQKRRDGVAKEVVRDYNAYVHQQINIEKNIQVVSKVDAAEPDLSLKDESPESGSAVEPAVKCNAKVFAFDFMSAHWGAGGASITGIEMLDSKGNPLSVIDGGGYVTVRVHCKAMQRLSQPIVGFSLRNLRGVEIISENTLGYIKESSPTVEAEAEFYADFRFLFPSMPVGDYFIGGAIADGFSVGGHTMHCRCDEAMRISVVNSQVVYGMVSMPMDHCVIEMK